MKDICLGSLQHCNSWLREESRKPDDKLKLDLPLHLAQQLVLELTQRFAKFSNTGRVSIVIQPTKISLSVDVSREMSI